MSALHAVMAYVVTAAAVATVIVALGGVAAGPRVRVILDRFILLTVVLLGVAALSGLPLLVLVGAPSDVLHLVYGAVAPLILLGGRYLGRGPDVRRRSAVVAVAGVAVLGVVYRLFTTGVASP